MVYLSHDPSGTVAHGYKHFTRFRVISRSLAYPLLTVLDDVTSWQAGDEIVVASTDFDWTQAEVKTIVQCPDCARNQIRVDGEFFYSHFGHVTYGVDERAEIGLLTRNIRVEGEVQESCYSNNSREKYLCDRFGMDTFGGHIKVVRGGFARIEHTELYHLGQQASKGHYPLHFHMCDEVSGQYFRNNCIRNSFSRCITVHGTDNATISDNVCFNHLGHGIFLEDSAERWNIIHRNLVLGTQHGTILLSDRKPDDCPNPNYCNLLASYWITRPENFLTDNVAAGGEFLAALLQGNGFVFVFADVPLGYSYNRQIERGLFRNMSAQFTKVARFSGNLMHSNKQTGLWFDSRISASQYHGGHYVAPDGIIKMNAFYDPREPPNENGTRTESVLSCFADTTTSVLSAHSTGTTSCDIRHSIFIGETENKGEPFTFVNTSSVYEHLPKEDKPTHHFDRSFSKNRPDAMQSAILMYQGLVFVDNCYFHRYYNHYYNDSFLDAWGYRPVRASAALSFHRTNHYPMVPRNGVMNLRFGYCDGEHDGFRVENGNSSSPYWKILDGNELTTFHDYDGSLTGTANTQIVRNRPFYVGPECLFKPQWDMAVCPYKYAQIATSDSVGLFARYVGQFRYQHYTKNTCVQLVIRGDDGVLSPKHVKRWAVLVSRDDQPGDVINMEGTNGLKYPVRVHKSYTIRFNNSLGAAPSHVEIKVKNGLEVRAIYNSDVFLHASNDVIRVAICFPKTTTKFRIKCSWPKINSRNRFPLWVDTLEQLDQDTTMRAFFWDTHTGFLLFKISSNETFTHLDQEAAGDAIPQVTITRLDGGKIPAVCNSNVPPYTNPKVRLQHQG
ncbi:transmembrane protein 2-like [Elysia marginata]|uniref:Transmembrane protein 2-like n=1 Tax=Elysia marginata TaxID=1093978 RepID=A0AAV4EXX1_9GAST|nr:transmembrane protein 2-like [Elysia marginata]